MEILKSIFGKNKEVAEAKTNADCEEMKLDCEENTKPLREIEVRMDGKTVKRIVPVIRVK